MADLRGFDANEVEPDFDFEAIPAGKYTAAIVASEFKPTKAGDGRYLELVFQILEGEYRGRQLWARLNLENRNETAVKIARAELSAICRATGVLQPKDSLELHDLPIVVTVKCQPREDNGEMANEIKRYARRDLAGAAPPAAAGAAPAPGTPPWKK